MPSGSTRFLLQSLLQFMTVKKCHVLMSESMFTLVSTFFPLFILDLNFLDILKVGAYILLIIVQSMELRNGLTSVTNPRERGNLILWSRG